jgi:inorganic pyrophosphatase
MADVDTFFPGEIDRIREWFTWYKATDPATGERDESKKNVFGFDGKALGTEKTWDVIREANTSWAKLVTRQVKAGQRKLA